MIRLDFLFNYLLQFLDFQWFVILSLFLMVASWFWVNAVTSRFINPTANVNNLKNNILSRVICNDHQNFFQFIHLKFCNISFYTFCLFLGSICYYFNYEYLYILWFNYISLWNWYYLCGIVIIFIIVIKFYSDSGLTNNINNETSGVLVLMCAIFLYYMNLTNLFSLVIIFECQNLLFLYFIAIVQVIKQNLGLNNLVNYATTNVSQYFSWQSSSLFLQYWAGFFGSIGLILSGILWGNNFGSVNWNDLSSFGYLFLCNINGNKGVVYLIGCLFIISILIKSGLFPFHFWNPDLYNNLSNWGMFWYVSLYTYAFFLLVVFIFSFYLFDWICIWYYLFWVLFIIGVVLLINVLFSITELKPFLAYMSIFHLLFILISDVINYNIGSLYSYIYIYIYVLLMIHLFSVIFSVRGKSINYLADIQNLTNFPSVMVAITCALAAMSGIPPFLGFWGNIGVVLSLYAWQEYVLGTVCLGSGLVLLYFYFQNYSFIGVLWDGANMIIIHIQNSYNHVIFWICLCILLNFIFIFLIGECINYGSFLMLLSFLH